MILKAIEKVKTVIEAKPYAIERAKPKLPVHVKPEPIIIESQIREPLKQRATLSYYLHIGRTYHKLARNAFVIREPTNYMYERVQWRTCAVAAAYAGLFGPDSIKNGLSKSQAIWRLSNELGYNIGAINVYGPTGRFQPIAHEMIDLVDIDGWDRSGVKDWLETEGF